MLGIYSFLLTVTMLLLSPLFLSRRQKYASGFGERLGNYPEFKHDGRKVIWLHCVSVGETNAARPLVEKLLDEFPDHRLIVSTTTHTGQRLAKTIFKDKADAVFYFPFDWKFSVRRALRNFQPSVILLMETEIWPRLILEAKKSGSKIAIVNGRLSERSFRRYSLLKGFVRRVLQNVDLALMQHQKDAERIQALGIDPNNAKITGNLKFDFLMDAEESSLSNELRLRFKIDGVKPLIIAASTHEPEEKWILEALDEELRNRVRLLIAPRHPERFNNVAHLLAEKGHSFARRSGPPTDSDKLVEVILLDSIGELRAAYPLAEIVFVGGSMIPHGGQSVLEPATAGRAIVTGWSTYNFGAVINEFLSKSALIQLKENDKTKNIAALSNAFLGLLEDDVQRQKLGDAAQAVLKDNQGSTEKTLEYLTSFEILSK